MTDEPHLSVSQLNTYLRCPAQYFFRYICGVRMPPNGNMTLGRAVHSAIEHNYRHKMQSGDDLPAEALQEVFSQEWDQQVGYTAFESKEKPGEMKDKGAALIELYRQEVAPQVQPAEVEREFLIDTGATELPLNGYIDLIDDQGTIIDHKTAGRSYRQDAVDRNLQLTGYSLAYRTLFGEEENGLRIDALVKTKTPKVQQLETTRSQRDIDRFLRLAQQIEQAINGGVFYPNEGFMCSGCRYTDMCEEW